MAVQHRSWMVILPLVLLGLMAVVLSCSPAETGPRVWIDWPRDGYETTVGTTVTLIAHAHAEKGVAEVQLSVDRQPYRVVTPDQVGEQFVEVSVEWFADEPGTYLLSVTAFDVNGLASNPVNVTVTVTGESPHLLITPGTEETPPPITPSPEEAAATLAPTETAPPPTLPAPTGTALPPTATRPAPTATPEPPRIVSFEVDRSEITAGECVRFSWRVEGEPTAIYFDGEGVTSPDSAERCVEATRSFELRAEGPSGADARSVTVVVIEPSPTPDTVGPPAPSLVSPTGNESVGCADVTLDWRRASDPSGIGTYYVKVEKEIAPGNWQSAGGWTTTDTQYTIPVAWLECGQTYRWAVAAEDGVGNMGPWSGWAKFTVQIT
jgi:hypothetical protein